MNQVYFSQSPPSAINLFRDRGTILFLVFLLALPPHGGYYSTIYIYFPTPGTEKERRRLERERGVKFEEKPLSAPNPQALINTHTERKNN